MTNPEPTDVGPAAGGDRPVAESDRQHVVTLLNSAHAEGVLDAPERDRRLAGARDARTFDDLVPLTRDLVTDRPSVTYDLTGSSDTDQIVAIFGGANRSGRWRVHADTNITAVFGGVELDLTDATFEAAEVHLNVSAMFGGVELTVPEGTEVISRVAAVFGGTDTHKLAPPTAGSPRIVLTGFALFGGIEIRHAKGVTHRARQQQRAAIRQARNEARADYRHQRDLRRG